MVTAGSDGNVYLTHLDNENKTEILKVGFSIRIVTFTLDNEYIVVAGKQGKVQFWKNNKLYLEWIAHYMCVRAMVFIENDVLVTSGDDSKIKIWKIDFNELTVNCVTEMVDDDIDDFSPKDINCEGLNIKDSMGLSPERRVWLIENGAVQQ
jgi:WD40 repeat protein